MDPIKAVTDFISKLFRQRVNRMESQAKQKVNSASVKARTAASKKVNNAIDGTIDKAKEKATNKRDVEDDS